MTGPWSPPEKPQEAEILSPSLEIQGILILAIAKQFHTHVQGRTHMGICHPFCDGLYSCLPYLSSSSKADGCSRDLGVLESEPGFGTVRHDLAK